MLGMHAWYQCLSLPEQNDIISAVLELGIAFTVKLLLQANMIMILKMLQNFVTLSVQESTSCITGMLYYITGWLVCVV